VSREAVELMRAGTDAFVSGDVDRAIELFHPEVEWHGTVGGIEEGQVWHGPETVVRNLANYFREWGEFEMRAERYIDAGGDDVVVFLREIAKGRESGIEMETETATIYTVRDGKLWRVRPFLDREVALRAAGLAPDTNVGVVRLAFAELGDDLTGSPYWDPEIEMVNAAGWVIEATYRGPEGVMRWWDDLAEAFEDFAFDLLDARELGDGRVLTTQRTTGRFRTTGLPFDGTWASIQTVRDGRVVRAEGYLNERRALRAAGLDPDA
jgi:ketosteroid isomerase-like protein